jgi:hypothetical protein
MTHRSKRKAVNTGTLGDEMFNVPKQLTFGYWVSLLSTGTLEEQRHYDHPKNEASKKPAIRN